MKEARDDKLKSILLWWRHHQWTIPFEISTVLFLGTSRENQRWANRIRNKLSNMYRTPSVDTTARASWTTNWKLSSVWRCCDATSKPRSSPSSLSCTITRRHIGMISCLTMVMYSIARERKAGFKPNKEKYMNDWGRSGLKGISLTTKHRQSCNDNEIRRLSKLVS